MSGDPTSSPGPRSQPDSTFLLRPAPTSSGENSRPKVQNVVADSSARRRIGKLARVLHAIWPSHLLREKALCYYATPQSAGPPQLIG